MTDIGSAEHGSNQVPFKPETVVQSVPYLDKENFQMQMKLTKNIGMLLLGAWLILSGLIPLLNFGFSGLGTIMAVLALAAGVLILLGR
jgi:hypothetical protein